MSRARVAVLKAVSGQLSITAAAAEYGYSRRHLHRLLARDRERGLDALEPRSRRPKTTPIATAWDVRERVIELRRQLTANGLDSGPMTIAWHLEREGPALSTSTIRRILHQAGLIVAQPRKRPRSSYTRFEAAQPNGMWQSDFMHWRLADGSDVEILNWLDDHSRCLLSCTAHQPVTGDVVVAVFLELIERYGAPASTLTDNGSVYTSRFTGGRNAFEYVLPLLGVRQKNGSPGHPQTQGKIERFQQTLQRWLAARPPATSTAELAILPIRQSTRHPIHKHCDSGDRSRLPVERTVGRLPLRNRHARLGRPARDRGGCAVNAQRSPVRSRGRRRGSRLRASR